MRRACFRPRLEVLEDRCLLTTVTNLLDNGSGSLRQAIIDTPSGGIVDFEPGLTGTIMLTGGQLTVNQSLTIAGPGVTNITVSGNHSSRVFFISAGSAVAISQLTIADGLVDGNGGGVANEGNLTLTNVVITGNQANSTTHIPVGSHTPLGGGGGIHNRGNLTLTASLIAGNRAVPAPGYESAAGAGIANLGTLSVTASTITANEADGSDRSLGGGIYNQDAVMTVLNSTLAGNRTGGGVAPGDGGGAFNGEGGLFTLIHCTIADNRAILDGSSQEQPGGGLSFDIRSTAGSLLQNSIVAMNHGRDFSLGIPPGSSALYNLIGIGEGSGITNGVNGNLVGSMAQPLDPRLGSLQDNGGPTPTFALLPASPAIDAGTNIATLTTDQRGFHRVVNNTTDIGAYEYQPPETTTKVLTSAHPSTPNQTVIIIISVTGTAPGSNLPSGTVDLFDNGALFQTLTLTRGSPSFPTATLAAGHHALTAHYSGFDQGDFHFASSDSAPFDQLVRARTFFAVGHSEGQVTHSVFLYRMDGTLIANFDPYGSMAANIIVAVGDINHDGFDDLIVYNPPFPFSDSPIKIYDGRSIANGTFDPATDLLYSFRFNDTSPINLAVGDVEGDGFLDLVVSGYNIFQDSMVKVLKGRDFADHTFNPDNPNASLLTQFLAYRPFQVTASVAVGDINGDGYGDIITGATSGNPHVKVFSGQRIADGTFDPANPDASTLASFFAYGLNFNVGVNVAVGDVNGDGFPDIITGATIGNPHVKIYNGQDIANGSFNSFNPDQSLLNQFFAFDLNRNFGVSVAAGDFEGNGRADIITGTFNGPPHQYRVVAALTSHGVRPPALNGIEGTLENVSLGFIIEVNVA